MGNELIFHRENAINLCSRVIEACRKSQKIFSVEGIYEKMLPEKQLVDVIPQGKTALWHTATPQSKIATWLFFACPGDKMVESTLYWKQFKEFYLKNPDFFDIENFSEYSHGKVIIPTKDINVHSEFWENTAENMEILTDRGKDYKGNPLSIFASNNYERNVKELKQFKGYGTGIASLYLIFLSRYNIKETIGMSPKIDRHLARMSAGCGVFDLEEGIRADKVSEFLSKEYTKVCNEEGFNPVILDPATWVIGKYVCSAKEAINCKMYCPLDDICSKETPWINKKDTRLYKKTNQKARTNFAA